MRVGGTCFRCIILSSFIFYTMTFVFSTVQVGVGNGLHQKDKCDQPNHYIVRLKDWLCIQGYVNWFIIIVFLLLIGMYRKIGREWLLTAALGALGIYTTWLIGWVIIGFIQLLRFSKLCISEEHNLYLFTFASACVGVAVIIVNPALAYFMTKVTHDAGYVTSKSQGYEESAPLLSPFTHTNPPHASVADVTPPPPRRHQKSVWVVPKAPPTSPIATPVPAPSVK